MNEQAIQEYNRGVDLAEQSRHDEALQAFEEALKLDPVFTPAWNGKGNALKDLGRHEEALQAFKKALKIDPEYAAAWNNKGNVLNNLGRHEKALESFENALEIDPEFASAWNGKGGVLYNLNRLAEARRCLLRSYYLDPTAINGKAIPVIAQAFSEKLSAPFFLQRLFTEHPIVPSLLTYRNLHFRNKEECRDCNLLLDFVVCEWDASEIEKRHLEGLIHFIMGDPMQAARVFQELLEKQGADCRSLFHLLLAFQDYNEPVEGESYRKYLASGIKAARDTLQAYRESRGLKGIWNRFRKSGSRRPGHEELYYAGQLFFLNGDFVQALELFQIAFQDSQFLPALYMQFWCLRKLRDPGGRLSDIVDKIQRREKDLAQAGRRGFLSETFAPEEREIDLRSPGWNRPFYKYMNRLEIEEGLTRLRAYPEIKELIGQLQADPPPEDIPGAFYSWRLIEKSRQELLRLGGERLRRETDRLREILRETVDDFLTLESCAKEKTNEDSDEKPDEKSGEELLEEKLAEHIKRGDFSRSQAQNLSAANLLLLYFFSDNRLSAQRTLLLFLFLAYKRMRSEKGEDRKELTLLISLTNLIPDVLAFFVNPFVWIVRSTITAVLTASLFSSPDELDYKSFRNLIFQVFETERGDFYHLIQTELEELDRRVQRIV